MPGDNKFLFEIAPGSSVRFFFEMAPPEGILSLSGERSMEIDLAG
ncbi:MAG: hypothetical protein Q9N34_07135 [Aquificota bacterium]|nr:hypothetical protein [Aquificota bacterium]